jgi:DNA-binding GntR family transcriptional regulator
MTFKSFEATILRLMRQHLQTAPDLPKSVKQHESLVCALEARSPEESAACTRTCILQGVKALKQLYEQG